MNTKPWQVIDSRTGAMIGAYATARAAHRRADKLDLLYGAVRYIVTPKIGIVIKDLC